MQLILGSVSTRSTPKSKPADTLVTDYISRASRLSPIEAAIFPSEALLLAAVPRQVARAAALLVLFDSHGQTLTSEAFAKTLGQLRDRGTQRLLFGIGPADGWSATARAAATLTISLGAMTLPHELARVIAAEQIYRALTILAGHPYHCGH